MLGFIFFLPRRLGFHDPIWRTRIFVQMGGFNHQLGETVWNATFQDRLVLVSNNDTHSHLFTFNLFFFSLGKISPFQGFVFPSLRFEMFNKINAHIPQVSRGWRKISVLPNCRRRRFFFFHDRSSEGGANGEVFYAHSVFYPPITSNNLRFWWMQVKLCIIMLW